MGSETIVTILLGLLAVGVPFATFLSSSRANKQQAKAEEVKAEAEARGVDALAYDRASKLYGDMIASLREQVDRLEASNEKLETEVASLRDANTRLVDEVVTLRQANASLGGEVVSLRAEITSMHRNMREGD